MENYRTQIHYLPSDKSSNVRCLNGSAHIMKSETLKVVTCPLCLEAKTNKDFWAKYNA